MRRFIADRLPEEERAPSFQDLPPSSLLEPGTRVGIVGSRDWPDPDAVIAYVNKLPPGTIVVSGGAGGVDRIAENAARARGLEVIIYPAKWKRADGSTDRTAGFKRNQLIVDASHMIVAFRFNNSAGTSDTVYRAQIARKLKAVVDR